MGCTEDDLMNFGALVFVIDGKDYIMQSHHWNTRDVNAQKKEGGSCSVAIHELDI